MARGAVCCASLRDLWWRADLSESPEPLLPGSEPPPVPGSTCELPQAKWSRRPSGPLRGPQRARRSPRRAQNPWTPTPFQTPCGGLVRLHFRSPWPLGRAWPRSDKRGTAASDARAPRWHGSSKRSCRRGCSRQQSPGLRSYRRWAGRVCCARTSDSVSSTVRRPPMPATRRGMWTTRTVGTRGMPRQPRLDAGEHGCRCSSCKPGHARCRSRRAADDLESSGEVVVDAITRTA